MGYPHDPNFVVERGDGLNKVIWRFELLAPVIFEEGAWYRSIDTMQRAICKLKLKGLLNYIVQRESTSVIECDQFSIQ
jgi:hypothetical protein